MHDFNGKARVFAACGLLAVWGMACSASSDKTALGSPSGSDRPGGSGMSPGSSSGGSFSGPNIVLGGNTASTDGGSATTLGTGGVCQAASHEGQRLPVDMYFLVDSSLSMNDRIGAGGTRWAAVSGALVKFLQDPKNSESALGLGYLPVVPSTTCQAGDPNCLCILTFCISLSFDAASCKVEDYSKPTVPLALPPNAAPLVTDLQQHQLNGGTPTRVALEGAVQYVNTWTSAHPGRKSVIVLATDGEPAGCAPNTPNDVATVAANALASPAAIQTFVIGVGSSLQSLNLVANAGGTDHAYLVEDSNAATAFADALEKIRGFAAPCDFSIPAEGTKIDPTKVNVKYTAAGSMSSTLLAQTSDGSANTCGPEGGWHYDNPQAPTAIKLCPTTCQSLGGGSVQVEFGCQTVVQPPR